ncbi:hypothetical protein C8Q77DRAFT_1162448 [Trametes polyzona]|nr:hypothetical protein C8Q77DRAFT_1162448 [Trametes polyzona]
MPDGATSASQVPSVTASTLTEATFTRSEISPTPDRPMNTPSAPEDTLAPSEVPPRCFVMSDLLTNRLAEVPTAQKPLAASAVAVLKQIKQLNSDISATAQITIAAGTKFLEDFHVHGDDTNTWLTQVVDFVHGESRRNYRSVRRGLLSAAHQACSLRLLQSLQRMDTNSDRGMKLIQSDIAHCDSVIRGHDRQVNDPATLGDLETKLGCLHAAMSILEHEVTALAPQVLDLQQRLQILQLPAASPIAIISIEFNAMLSGIPRPTSKARLRVQLSPAVQVMGQVFRTIIHPGADETSTWNRTLEWVLDRASVNKLAELLIRAGRMHTGVIVATASEMQALQVLHEALDRAHAVPIIAQDQHRGYASEDLTRALTDFLAVVSRMEAMLNPSLIISWKPQDSSTRVLIKFCLREDFWAFSDDVAQAKLMDADTPIEAIEHLRKEVYANFEHLVLLASAEGVSLKRLQAGWPDAADMAKAPDCWCE